MLLYIMMYAPNMTDYLIGLFGWDAMQPLWDFFDMLFWMLNSIFPNNDMWDTVWEVLFT